MWVLGTTKHIYKTEAYEEDNYDTYMYEESGFIFYLKNNLFDIERFLNVLIMCIGYVRLD